MSSSTPERTADEFVRMTFVLRMLAVLLTLVWLADVARGRVPGVMAALLVGAALSLALLRWWEWVAPILRPHPALFMLDVVLAGTLLMLTSPTGPFYLYTLGTAMLAGVLYGRFGAVFFSLMLCGCYGLAVNLWNLSYTFMEFVGLPCMYFVFGLGGAHIMAAWRRQADDTVRLAEVASQEAASQERARLARELHDSVTKTVTGVAFQASALRRRLIEEKSPALQLAERLSGAVDQAMRESRSALVTLRQGALTAPFPEVLAGVLAEVGEEADLTIRGRALDQAEIHDATVRFEVVRIVTEALRNAVAHAGTEDIDVEASSTPQGVTIVVRDHGRGFDPEVRGRQAADQGHFGLAGMRERAEQLGGAVELDSRPGEGTTVTIHVPCEPGAGSAAPARVGPVNEAVPA